MIKSDITRNYFMLKGPLAKKGYDWWWHSFTAENEKTGEKKPFFIEYFLCNPYYAEDKPVIIWNDTKAHAKNMHPSYVMINGGWWGRDKGQLHNFYPWKDISIEYNKPLNLKVNDCILTETYMKGSIYVDKEDNKIHEEWMSDYGSLVWDIKINKIIPYNVGYGASKFFRTLNAFEMFWHAEGMKTEYSGYIILNGEKYIVKPETCNGYADKNWGSDFTSPWVWLSSNNLISNITGKKLNNSVFDIGGGRPKVFFIPLKHKLLGAFYYEGKEYEFNFSKFWTGAKTYFKCIETDEEIKWHVIQSTFKAKMETEITCQKDEMILINYESPDGFKRHNRLWNGGTGKGRIKLYEKVNGEYKLIDDIKVENAGCEYGEYSKNKSGD